MAAFMQSKSGVVTLGLWQKILSVFSSKAAVPSDVPRLRAGTQSELAASLALLPDREKGWITLAEARTLFSHMDEQYAFGEMDEQGKSSLAEFAAQPDHRSSFQIMPVEGRIYFTRERT